MPTPSQILLSLPESLQNKDTYNALVSNQIVNMNGHDVQLIDGDTMRVDGQKYRFKGGDTYESRMNPRTGVMPSGEELSNGIKGKHITARQLLSNSREQELLNKSKDITSNVLGRNQKVSELISNLSSNVKSKFSPSTEVQNIPANAYDITNKLDPVTLKPITDEQVAKNQAQYDDYTKPSNYLLGLKQVVNKAVGSGVISNVLPNDIVQKANTAYSDNQKYLNDIEQYHALRGNVGHNVMLSASEIAPEIASELATAIPIAGQIGKISAIANLANKGKLGAIAAEGLKWGGAEVPASYLLGNQDHLGERVAMGVAGGVVGEGLIQGGKALFKKAGELKEKIPVGKTSEDVKAGEYEPRVNTPEMPPEGSTINEVPKEGTNTPEVPVDENKPILESNMNTVDGSGGTSVPQAEVKKKLTTKEINKGIADTIDMGTDYVVGSVKKMLEEPHIKSLVDSGLDIGKAARDTISKTLDKSKFGKDFKERFSMEGESQESIFKNLTSDIDTTLRGQMFNKMIAVGKKGETESIQVGDFVRANSKQLMKDMPEGGEPLRKAFTKHYLHTDFQAIDKTVKSFDDVVNYLKENRSIYNQFKKEIDQAALALKDRGAMNSKHYYNNAEAIAKTKGIKDPDVIEKIDKLISMKSLTKEDLDFILANRGQPWFDDLVEKAQEASKLSKSLFEKDPHNYMKGYYKEIYGKDLYSHEFDITGKDTKTWKFLERPEYVKGALPVNAIKKPIGAEVTTAKALNSADASTRAEALDALRSAGKTRVVRDAQGKPLSYHKVLNEERRATELNKNYDAADILASTYQSILKKHGVNDLVKYIKEETGDTFISYKPKDGFVRMPQSEAVLLPKELRGQFKDGKYEIYLPKDLKHQLIGNQAIGYTEKASLLNGFHRFMADASSHFKHNVIITSFRSYFVNELGGWTAALRQGMSIGEIRGYLKELEGQTKQMRQVQNQYFHALTSGKDVTKLEAKLRSIPLVKMRDEGLSLTMIHDYMAHSGNRSVSHDLAETGLEKLYKFLGKEKQHPLATKDVLQLEDGTYGGEVASLIMSNIDARWRYVITKGLMDKKGHSMTEAVNLANSIFGNANKITPRIVQYADNMLIMPFGSWIFRVLAGNIKANKDNMAQALGIYTTMKALSAGTGYNLNSGDSTQIPLSGVNSAKRMGFDNIFNAANPFHEPLYASQLIKAGSSQNPLDAILTPNR